MAAFPCMVSALTECMAVRHLDTGGPGDRELWHAAAKAFVTIVQVRLGEALYGDAGEQCGACVGG